MKTLKLRITVLALQLKKIFFNAGIINLNKYKEDMVKKNLSSLNDVDKMRLEEYMTVYKNTTRWQTV